MTPDRRSRLRFPQVAFATPRILAREGTGKADVEKAISRYAAENPILLYTHREDAEESAKMAAPSRPDDQEWQEIEARAAPHGGGMSDARRIVRGEAPLGFQLPPAPYFYVIVIELGEGVHIGAAGALTKPAQLEFSREQPELDVLLLPKGLLAGECLRVVTHRELLGHFTYRESYRVYGRPRRPA